MLEIMPESEYDKGYVHLDGALKEHHQFKRFSIVSTQQASEHSEDLIEQLLRIKKKLLLKSNRSATRFTISRGSGRYSAEQVKVLASMLPDELIHSPSDYQLREFEGAVFFADISGFTDLSAKYSNLDNGASKLSMVLNFYLGTMVQEILSHGGDIIKYSGDAFLAIFKAENEGLLQEVVHRAIDTAIIIQENCKNYRTEVGVVLNVKIAISGGTVTFSLIGNEHSSHYAMIGDPVWQVKALQEKINPGEILVTPKAWFYIQETLYEYLYMRSFRYYKVVGFKDHLGIAQRAHEAILNFDEMKHKLEKTFDANSISSAKFPNSSAISSAKFEPSVDPYFADLKTPRDSYSCKFITTSHQALS